MFQSGHALNVQGKDNEMTMEEYERKCLRKESEMLDEESRKDGQVANEHWIDALERAIDLVGRHDMSEWKKENRVTTFVDEGEIHRVVRNVLNGIRNEAAMLLPKDHEKYMDQQGDEPNKKPKQEG